MKDGVIIKTMWLVMEGAVKASLPVLGISDPETFWKEVKKIYRREMDRLPEYGPNDILKPSCSVRCMKPVTPNRI